MDLVTVHTMRVTVRYLSQLKRAAACAEERVDMADGCRLTDLLAQVATKHGDAFRAMLFDDASAPRKSLLFFVGDEHSELTRILRDGDEVMILTPMAGG